MILGTSITDDHELTGHLFITQLMQGGPLLSGAPSYKSQAINSADR